MSSSMQAPAARLFRATTAKERSAYPGTAALLLLLLLCWATWLRAQETSPRLDVAVERLTGGHWRAEDPRTVFASGDRIRFRFSANPGGWLYVHYAGSGGQNDWLVPDETTQPGRLVVADQSITVPADSSTRFTVTGPPGFDIVYWILSPRPLPAEALLPTARRTVTPNTMRPRCRVPSAAPCLDDRAGPAPLAAAPDLPVRRSSGLRARELKIEKDAAGSRIEPVDRAVGAIVYEFRLAHR
ncbi:MAG: DUF4384 domain-containing protein [Bryobacterales bacterium]|nr:DUF4384 domain-containing protein [Bryobacterales bacterium]